MWVLRNGKQEVVEVVDLVERAVLVVAQLIVVARQLEPWRTPIVKVVPPPFHDVGTA